MPVAGTSRRVRFGPFELDAARHELRKHGSRIRLSHQLLHILTALIEAQGQVVTREVLRTQLWPHNNFGDLDHSLNVAVKKLRDRLGDSAAKPRYIGTVERQGYRFIGVVEAEEARLDGDNEQEQANVGSNGRPGLLAHGSALDVTRVRLSRKAAITGCVALSTVLLLATAITRKMRPAPHVLGYLQLTHSGVVHPNQKLLTDGPRLYFIERTNGAWVGKWMPTTGGPATPLSLPFAHYDLQDISPGGDELMGRDITGYDIKDMPVWTAPLSVGAPRRVGPGTDAAAYSADGRSILYASGKTIIQADRDGSNPHQLLEAPGEVLSLSPNGDLLRITVEESDVGLTQWEARRDGSSLHRLLPAWKDARSEWGGSWTPDGQWYTFSAVRNRTRDLWLLNNANTSQLVQLTSGPMEFRTPVFSRDGKRIFCVGILRRGELLSYKAPSLALRTAEPLRRSGGTARRFAPVFEGMSAEQLEYSRDGKWITYITYPEQVLWTARADGSERRQLTSSSMRVLGPHWSPDGSEIAFEMQHLGGEPWKLCLMPSAGGPQVELTVVTGIGGFTWSKDGRSLIIGDVMGGRLKLLDLRQRTLVDIPQSEGLANPSLSPDGSHVAATIQPSETLVVFDLASHQRRELAREAQYPTWSPDGQFIYFNSFEGSSPAMYRVKVSDARIETLFNLDEFTAIGSWGFWSSVTPDGSILLMRDTGNSDVYAVDLQLR
jgi:Tol biopolymer transport system component/DNA-binding winged helix-turn-helix (wHTH) protein